jgi:hypothetical protein
LTKCEHVFYAFDPYHLFLCSWEQLFQPRFRALGWWNVRYICFRLGWSHTAVPEQANTSDKISLFSLLPSLLLLVCPVIVGQNQVPGFEQQFWIWPSSKLNLQSEFSWLLMLHCSVQTCVARTPTFLSFVHQLFWLLSCDYAPSILVSLVQVRIVARLGQFLVRITVNI